MASAQRQWRLTNLAQRTNWSGTECNLSPKRMDEGPAQSRCNIHRTTLTWNAHHKPLLLYTRTGLVMLGSCHTFERVWVITVCMSELLLPHIFPEEKSNWECFLQLFVIDSYSLSHWGTCDFWRVNITKGKMLVAYSLCASALKTNGRSTATSVMQGPSVKNMHSLTTMSSVTQNTGIALFLPDPLLCDTC